MKTKPKYKIGQKIKGKIRAIPWLDIEGIIFKIIKLERPIFGSWFMYRIKSEGGSTHGIWENDIPEIDRNHY
jgi:hypothetical protein